jgi:chromosome segregation ATPase
MNRYYIIVPIVLMAVFVYFERGAAKDAVIKEQRVEADKQKDIAKKEAEKKELEEKAKIDTERRNAQRLKEEKEKDDARKAKYEAGIQKMRDDLKRYTDDVDLNNKLVAKLEKDLADKRDQRERENRAVFELSKKVELSKKMRRNAELEVQRYTEMLSSRAAESILAKPPVVAAASEK